MLVDGRLGLFGEYRNYSDVSNRESVGRISYISRLVITIMNESLYADNSYYLSAGAMGGCKILSMMVDRGLTEGAIRASNFKPVRPVAGLSINKWTMTWASFARWKDVYVVKQH
jgi:hypothetical protein